MAVMAIAGPTTVGAAVFVLPPNVTTNLPYQSYGLSITYSHCLKSSRFCHFSLLSTSYCSELKAMRARKKVHMVIKSTNCVETHETISSELVGINVECGDLAGGRSVGDGIGKDCVFAWNQLMNERAKIGEYADCMGLFEQMVDLGVELNTYCFTTVLKCLAALGSVEGGMLVHGLILRLGFLDSCVVGNALIACYSKCRKIEEARKVFDEMLVRDVITYNSVINAYVSNGYAREGIEVLKDMWFSGIGMDLATLVCVLPACTDMFLWQGRALHGYAVKADLMNGTALNNSLLSMYVRCGLLAAGVQLFRGMKDKNEASWTLLISGYARRGQFDKALDLFYELEGRGVRPDLFATTSILNACACSGSLDCGKRIHDYILKNGLEQDLCVANSLMDMYAKCGNMDEAKLIFDNMTEKDIISWNTMIGGYSKNAFPDKAINMFVCMQPFKKPNAVTIASMLPACADLSVLDRGREIHGFVLRNGFFEDRFVVNALIDMYCKCAALALACQLFGSLAVKDVISWTVMIAGYGIHGKGGEAISAFNKMREMGVKPNEISFTAILFSCARSGLVVEGRRIFNIMRHDYKIVPKMDHYASMVDLLGRAGRLNEAYNFIESMRIMPDSSVWGALLKACKFHRNANLAEKVAQRLFELEPEIAGHYLLLADVYTEVEMWEAVNRIRGKNRLQKAKKSGSFCWIEIRSKVQVFASGDRSYPQATKIDAFLHNVRTTMEQEGVLLKKNYAMNDLEQENKEVALCGHSERLAISLGILSLPVGKPIRVTKNSRICLECHETAKFITKITGRKIIVRDSNWFHHFEKGKCSCRGYW